MGHSGGNDNDIPGMKFVGYTVVAAELDFGGAVINSQNFVCSTMIVMIRIDPVTPHSNPAICSEQLFNDGPRIRPMLREHHRLSVKQKRQCTVWKGAVILQFLGEDVRLVDE